MSKVLLGAAVVALAVVAGKAAVTAVARYVNPNPAG